MKNSNYYMGNSPYVVIHWQTKGHKTTTYEAANITQALQFMHWLMDYPPLDFREAGWTEEDEKAWFDTRSEYDFCEIYSNITNHYVTDTLADIRERKEGR